MRKLVASIGLMAAIGMYGSPVGYDRAVSVAREFMGREIALAPPSPREAPDQATEYPAYYFFTPTQGEGFVIIGGDDSLPKIIGYSDTSNPDPGNLPPQLEALLSGIEKHIGGTLHPSWEGRSTLRFASGKGKLLQTALWDQAEPFNLQCPAETVTGCVPTAMAIVMKYHNWPNRGRGSNYNRYDPAAGEYSFDTDFDWDNALMDYTDYYDNPGKYTKTQIDAVAKIMHACGIALEAAYMPGGMTSADEHDCAYAMRTFFKYDGNIGFAGIGSINADGDNALGFIKKELDAGFPMLMGGSFVGMGAGHVWVIDGYDANDMLHVNWGWGGQSNGYFSYPVLGYYTAGSLVYNIRPSENYVEYSPWELPPAGNLNLDVAEVKTGEYFNAFNYCIDCTNLFHFPEMEPVCSGKLAVALVDSKGNIKEILREMQITDWFSDRLKGATYFTGLKVTKSILPSDRIALISKSTGYDQWMQFAEPPFVQASCPVVGNKPKVADIKINFLGPECEYRGVIVNTDRTDYSQSKPMAGGIYNLDFYFPKNKDKIWVSVKGQLEQGWVFPEGTYPSGNAMVYLPYSQGEMIHNVNVYAFEDSDLYSDWYEVELTAPGTLESLIQGSDRIRIQKLRISGTMDSQDFSYINYSMPMVKHLDLRNVNIVKDLMTEEADYIPNYALERKRLKSIVLPENLKGIGLEALRENAFSELIIPSQVAYLGLGSFWDSDDDSLASIYMFNPTPPTIQEGQSGNEEHMFGEYHYLTATLYVPKGSKEAYLSEPFVWHNFINVKEFDPAGIESILTQDSNNQPVEIFDLQGKRVYRGNPAADYPLKSGVYIVKRGLRRSKIII